MYPDDLADEREGYGERKGSILLTLFVLLCSGALGFVVVRPAALHDVADAGREAYTRGRELFAILREDAAIAARAIREHRAGVDVEVGAAAPAAQVGATAPVDVAAPVAAAAPAAVLGDSLDGEPTTPIDEKEVMSLQPPAAAPAAAPPTSASAPDTANVEQAAAVEDHDDDVVILEAPVEDAQPAPRRAAARVRRPRAKRVAHKRPAVAPTPDTGFLRINTRPWSEVYVDGESVGHTPLVHVELPVGRHRVVLKNPDFSLQKSFWVQIRPGKANTHILNL